MRQWLGTVEMKAVHALYLEAWRCYELIEGKKHELLLTAQRRVIAHRGPLPSGRAEIKRMYYYNGSILDATSEKVMAAKGRRVSKLVRPQLGEQIPAQNDFILSRHAQFNQYSIYSAMVSLVA